jgi:hypothetical protein
MPHVRCVPKTGDRALFPPLVVRCGEHVSGAAYLVYVAVPMTLALTAFGDPVDDGIVSATDPEIVLPTCPKSVTEIVIESPITVCCPYIPLLTAENFNVCPLSVPFVKFTMNRGNPKPTSEAE